MHFTHHFFRYCNPLAEQLYNYIFSSKLASQPCQTAAKKLDSSPDNCIYLDIQTAHSKQEVSHVVQSSEVGEQSRGAYS